jgi:hypothetical protein
VVPAEISLKYIRLKQAEGFTGRNGISSRDIFMLTSQQGAKITPACALGLIVG